MAGCLTERRHALVRRSRRQHVRRSSPLVSFPTALLLSANLCAQGRRPAALALRPLPTSHPRVLCPTHAHPARPRRVEARRRRRGREGEGAGDDSGGAVAVQLRAGGSGAAAAGRGAVSGDLQSGRRAVVRQTRGRDVAKWANAKRI